MSESDMRDSPPAYRCADAGYSAGALNLAMRPTPLATADEVIE